MTDKQQSDALHLADELEDSLESHDGSSLTARCQGIADAAAAELLRLHAENETLRTGYEAARLEIESLRAAQPAGAQQPGTAGLVGALEDAQRAINSMKVEAETAAQGDEQMMLEACETISNEGLQADMAIRAALASHGQAPASRKPKADSVDYVTEWAVTLWKGRERIRKELRASHGQAQAAPQTSPAAQGDALESEYQRGYRQGYEQRDAEVRGALV